jgi:hypothetical protein
MHEAMKMTYTGCVEAVNHGGTFLLTHIGEGGGAMHDMGGEPKAMKDDMSGPPFKPTALVLSGRAHLTKQVGKRVAITGAVEKGTADSLRSDLDTLRVDSLKVVAKSCM